MKLDKRHPTVFCSCGIYSVKVDSWFICGLQFKVYFETPVTLIIFLSRILFMYGRVSWPTMWEKDVYLETRFLLSSAKRAEDFFGYSKMHISKRRDSQKSCYKHVRLYSLHLFHGWVYYDKQIDRVLSCMKVRI